MRPDAFFSHNSPSILYLPVIEPVVLLLFQCFRSAVPLLVKKRSKSSFKCNDMCVCAFSFLLLWDFRSANVLCPPVLPVFASGLSEIILLPAHLLCSTLIHCFTFFPFRFRIKQRIFAVRKCEITSWLGKYWQCV